MKAARFAILSCAALWLGARWVQSYAFHDFVARLTADVRTAIDYGIVVLVPVTLIGVPWLIARALRHR